MGLCLLDDWDLSDQRPKVLKAFLDPSQAEAMMYVRWGATKFVQSQARSAAETQLGQRCQKLVLLPLLHLREQRAPA